MMGGHCFKRALIALAVLAVLARADDTTVAVPSWVENGGWIILVLACLAMFYGLAMVVEEFFVPALNTVSAPCIGPVGVPRFLARVPLQGNYRAL